MSNKISHGTIFLPILLAVVLCFSINAVAQQPNPYNIDFETGPTVPARKSYATEDTIFLNGYPWKMPGVFLGTMTTSDFLNGAHSARFRLTDNTSGNPAYMEMLTDLKQGIENISLLAAMWGNETGGQLQILFSIDSGQNWIPATDTVNITANKDSAMLISADILIRQPIRLLIRKTNTSNNRINIDDISITRFGNGRRLLIKSVNPYMEEVSADLDSLIIRFDQAVNSYIGNLSIHQKGGLSQKISIPSSKITTHDSVVIIKGIQLIPESEYYVTLTDSAFVDTTASMFSLDISDSTFWTFRTKKKIIPPHIPPLTNLDESFLACNSAQGLLGLFKQFNVAGQQQWECSNEGHEDSFAVAISGGFGKNLSAKNEDWLILRRPLDLSAMSKPFLSFWQKASFDGNVKRTVKVSFNYSGDGDPTADSIIWEELNIPGINQKPTPAWTYIDGIDLSIWKHQPFYLAFTYSCGTDGAYKLLYDGIKISTSLGIGNAQKYNQLIVKPLGFSNGKMLQLQTESSYKTTASFSVFTMDGIFISIHNYNIKNGKAFLSVPLEGLSSGIYFLKVKSDKTTSVIRFVVL